MCFTVFCAGAEPLLDRLTISQLIAEYKRVMPIHYKTMKGILGYDKKKKIKDMNIWSLLDFMIESCFTCSYSRIVLGMIIHV